MAYAKNRQVRSGHTLAHAQGQAASLESLEPRTLMSSAPALDSIAWNGREVEAISGSWILTLDRQMTTPLLELRARSLARSLGVGFDSVSPLGLGYAAELRVTGAVLQHSAERADRASRWVDAIEPNSVARVSRVPNDPFFTQQWQLENTGQNVPGSGPGTIGADSSLVQAWDITTGSAGVIVAVIDTGVQLDHPDLAANIWRNPGEIAGNGIDDDGNGFVDDVRGWDFANLDNDASDDQGHGTSVAGTIGAVGNNGIGVSGVAWTVSLLPLKASDQFGLLPLSATVGSIDYLTMMRGRGHNIVAANASYGTFAPLEAGAFRQAERDAIVRFINSGGTFVASAGNDGQDIDPVDEQDRTAFPAGYDIPGLISVAATDNNDALASFSNYGRQGVDLAAPGANVRTTALGGGYTYISGTSFSAPMVTGAVALLRTVRPDASGEELRRVLIESSDPLPSLQTKVVSGGRLNVAEALRIIGLDGPVVTSIAPGPVTGQVGADGSAISRVTVTFNRDLNGSLIDAGFVSLVGDGTDNTFGTGDDRTIPLGSVTLTGPRTVTIQLNLQSFLQQRLPVDRYRLTLNPAGFRDTDGNFLNGDAVSGTPEVYDFLVVSPATPFEPNDSLGQATPASFSASGSASFTGLTIGDGVRAGLDVDLFKVTIPRGGLIRASVIAQNRLGGSELDSYVRLFDAFGQELASNDQFNGADALVDYFVSTGGIYYVGVSGFGNASYNPNAPGSGQTQSTGVYDLLLEVELIQEDRVTLAQDFGDDPPRLPPQGTQGTLSDSLVFNDARSIRDVNVRVDIDHDYTSDLRISLISPQGTEVVLANRRGGDGNDYTRTLFDDEATKTIARRAWRRSPARSGLRRRCRRSTG
ncbi:MAG: S8 family serine peptidase [Phycisphaeraceae bacterium]|nr:S8 family serine peptidase [Phycisphaeraceae bacterium]